MTARFSKLGSVSLLFYKLINISSIEKFDEKSKIDLPKGDCDYANF